MINQLNINALVPPPPVGTAVYSEAMQCATVRHTSCLAVAHFLLRPPNTRERDSFVKLKLQLSQPTLCVGPLYGEDSGLAENITLLCHPEQREGSQTD